VSTGGRGSDADGPRGALNKDNQITHGNPPFTLALLHGGPGAAGEVSGLAQDLSEHRGVLEPLQAALTVDGQVEELAAQIRSASAEPVDLAGFSWGAMLGLLTAARHPSLVRKLILISSGALDEAYVPAIAARRLERMSERDKLALGSMVRAIKEAPPAEANLLFARLGELICRVDAFDPIPDPSVVDYRYDVFASVWKDAEQMRRDGEFVESARALRCPVVAIHGEADPHPAKGVFEPLARSVDDFTAVLLEDCGHKPWAERSARDTFFEVMHSELG
jgi:pimeloyl-ACP methyl ester carboxylesterase